MTRAGINIRGSSTATEPQSQFALELWDEYNQDQAKEFLGMPAESDWVLYGQNGYDTSYLHNPLPHQLSRDVGRYSSRTRFAEVFLNTAGGLAHVQPAGRGQLLRPLHDRGEDQARQEPRGHRGALPPGSPTRRTSRAVTC